ncbi:MAG: baseplate J/gp47 family protein [Candidatus Spyradenecus sp.]
MAEETFPRWGLQPVAFVETDPAKIEAEIITAYEQASGRTLADGDPVRLFLLTIAAVIIQQRACINLAAQQNLLSYATGANLDALGNNLSVARLAASPAVTTLRFTLAQALGTAYIIPMGYEVTNGTVTFATDDEAVIPIGETTVEVSATCTEGGTQGNKYLPGQITTAVKPMTFLAKAENITETAGGSDAESDADYAERIRLAPNRFSVAGPTKAYVFHAYSANAGVIDVGVNSPSPGEVKVYPLMAGGTLPTEDVCKQIAAYLSSEDIRPLTDHVEVLPPTAKEYTIYVDYWIARDKVPVASSIQKAVEAAVEDYRVWQQAKIGRDITPDQLIKQVVEAGAARVDFATLQPAFATIAADEVAQCTGVTITYKGAKDE